MDFKYEALNLLKTLFTKQVFKDAKLQDGTIVSAEAFEPGQELMIIDEAGNKTPAPDGEHYLEDGTCVYVSGGKIDKLEKPEMEDGIEEEVTIEEMSIDTTEIEPLVEEVETEDEMAYLRTMMEECMARMGVIEEEMTKMKMSKQETDEIFKNGIIELSDNFSKIPGSEKTTITPAGDFESKFTKVSKVGKKDSIVDWITKNNKS
jgi:hypothetical protein